MNINSVSDPTYRDINENEQLCKAYETAANNSMKRACLMPSSPTHQSDMPLAHAKIHGAWKKRVTSSKQSERV